MPRLTDDDDLLAAEFALGLLEPDEAEAVQRRARADAPLSLRIAWWRDQLAPLAREAEATPPADLWARIAAQLPGNDNDVSRAITLARRWRAAAVGAMTVAAALLVFIGTRPGPVQIPVPRPAVPSAPLVATLAGDKNAAVVTVAYDSTTGRMTIAPNALDAGRGDAELWIIPEDGKARSLGVIDARHARGQVIAADHRGFVHEGATFAISLEPKGGSPTGQATGPIVVTGKIIRT